MFEKPKLLQNAVKITDDGKVIYLFSANRHDFRSYESPNGYYAVDGGLEYCRTCTGENNRFVVEDMSLTTDTDIAERAAKRLVLIKDKGPVLLTDLKRQWKKMKELSVFWKEEIEWLEQLELDKRSKKV